ncbi:MAG TPA: LysR substrate-binding domain-containing protein [Thermoanaerobaculia bacterium]|nr:LysR substrate-binding domain-containing protein [Thermoanaerobaculia bacterium]
MPALPTLRQLAYLVALSERLNFRLAAEAQFVSQSTLSAGIKELERVLGVQLVERDTRHVRLTAIGESVATRGRELLAAATDLTQAARSAARPLSGPLRLGAIPTIAPYLLPRVLPALRRAHGELRLYLREDLTGRLLERLRAGSLDVALIALPYDTGDLYVRELFKDEFSFVAREADPAVRSRDVALRKVDTADMLLLEEGHCLRDHVIAACGPRRAAGAGAGEPRIEATSLTTLIQMVEGGLGVTLLPRITLDAGILRRTRLVARPFSSPAPSRMLALVARRTSPRLRDADLLAEFLIREHRRPGPRRDSRSQAQGG